ncbi:radical SAM protein [Anaeromyxobacter paludicola]|uniref:Dual-specificity RNA methyltransferase RlmN n=1 Tax=Anaeromyxobacter paludicola TaxID=2918171 RepID=A0ABN6N9E1_9BACT|nr:radical SAM protein [Anaeromyxobacter paludicola]BDG09860.1 dual-specificity RNA methyltransferase RlmN [Anaeromyxobacter paludicola]
MLHLQGQDSRALARALGIELADARRIVGAVIGRGEGLRGARNVRREVLDRAERAATPGALACDAAVDAKDGFRKYLFRCPDGAKVEAVRIPLFDTHYTMCLSSQAGCALGCAFCATGRMGLARSLASWEMVAQFLHLRADSARPITGAVFMGQGEPFHNYEAVLAAAYALCDPSGGRIDQRRISISTAGVAPMIRRYTAEGHKFRLCVSLNAAIPEKRAGLMPVEKGYPLDELVDAVREHAAARGRVTLEYVMMAGVNVGDDDAAALGRLLAGIPVRLNPIDVNDATGRFRPPSPEEWRTFRDALARELPGQPVVRRYSGGQDEHAACGMLASRG